MGGLHDGGAVAVPATVAHACGPPPAAGRGRGRDPPAAGARPDRRRVAVGPFRSGRGLGRLPRRQRPQQPPAVVRGRVGNGGGRDRRLPDRRRSLTPRKLPPSRGRWPPWDSWPSPPISPTSCSGSRWCGPGTNERRRPWPRSLSSWRSCSSPSGSRQGCGGPASLAARPKPSSVPPCARCDDPTAGGRRHPSNRAVSRPSGKRPR